MIRFLSIILVILSFSSAYCQDKVDGWGKVKWGMKPEEVSKAYNGKVDPFEEKKDGLSYLITLPNSIIIADYDFDVRFAFDKNKRLNAVNLYGLWADSTVFDKIHDMLLTKYKNPLKDEKKRLLGAIERSLFWTKDTTSIQLIFAQFETGTTYVSLIYRSTKGGSGAENL
jgi:hypothetical protein